MHRMSAMTPRHLTFSSDGRTAHLPSQAHRLAALHTLVRLVGPRLFGFCLVDDHLHVAPLATEGELPQVRRRLLMGLGAAGAGDLDPAHVRTVDTRSYQIWLLEYLLLQPVKHGLSVHPALWEGSFFQDLVGARHLPGLALQVWEVLPRFRLRQALRIVGLPQEPLVPVDGEVLALAGPAAIAGAGGAGVAAPAVLGGGAAPVVRAGRDTARLLSECGVPRRTIQDTLGASRTGVQHLLRAGGDPQDLLATRTRLALEQAVASSLLGSAA